MARVKDNWRFPPVSIRGVRSEWEMQALVDAMHQEDDDATATARTKKPDRTEETTDAELASYEALRRS